MELKIRGKNLEVTKALHSYVEKHTGKIQRYFDKPIKMNVLMRISNKTNTCEVTAFVEGVILRGVEKSNVFSKKVREEKETFGEEEFEIVKTKKFNINPMSPEEAILQMNLVGHDFFMFFNSETSDIAVVYKRNDGKYGLIEMKR